MTCGKLICFSTRKTFQEAVLGLVVRECEVLRYGKSAKLLQIEAINLLSLDAFDQRYRRGVYNAPGFRYFLPLALDNAHFTRALPAIRKFLDLVQYSSDHLGFLHVVPNLMNNIIVNLMQSCDCSGISQAALQEAFDGYCLLFHLFTKLCWVHPDLKIEARAKLSLFVSCREARNKQNFPDIGEFLALVPVALEETSNDERRQNERRWNKLCACIVDELLTRNVVSMLRQTPGLASNDGDLESRLSETFRTSRSELKLTMLQARFMRAVVKHRDRLAESHGFSPDSTISELLLVVTRIYKVAANNKPVDAWKGFFALMQYHQAPDKEKTEKMLKLAIRESERKKYHHLKRKRRGKWTWNCRPPRVKWMRNSRRAREKWMRNSRPEAQPKKQGNARQEAQRRSGGRYARKHTPKK